MYTSFGDTRKNPISGCRFLCFILLGLLFLTYNNSFAQQPIPVSLPDNATGDPNSTVLIPITVGDLTGRNVSGYTAFIQYNNSVLRAIGVDITNTLSEEALANLTFEVTVDGSTSIIFLEALGVLPFSGSGTLAYLQFEVVGGFADSTNLLFSPFLFNVGSPPAQSSNGKFTVNFPDIEVSPLLVDFGHTFLDSIAERTLQVTNNGTYTLTVSNANITGGNAIDFSVAGNTFPVMIAPGETRALTVQFVPNTAGMKQAILNIESDDPDDPIVSVNLSGVGEIRPEPDIIVTPEVIDFGEVTENTSAVRQIEVENVGTAALEINNILIENDSRNDFSIDSEPFPILIAPNSQGVIEVVFSPASPGSAQATVVIQSNDPDQPRSEVQLSGTATPQPEPIISLSTASLNFPATFIDSTAVQSFIVRNIGNAELIISELNFSGPDFNEFSAAITPPIMIQPQDSREIEVAFVPDSEGEKVASLQIVSNDLNNPEISIALNAQGEVPEPDISLDISSLEFDDVFGDSTKSAFFTIKNAGSANLDIFSITTTGANPNDFLIEGVSPPFTLFPRDSQVVEVVFAPRATGVRRAIIKITTNIPGNEVIEIPVSGFALPPLRPEIFVSSDTLFFGTVEVEADSTIDLFVGNSGEANLRIDDAMIKNQAMTDFRYVAPALPFEIPPGDSQKIEVIFNPNRDGLKTATLEITSNAPNQPVKEVFLQGSGILAFILFAEILTPDSTIACDDSITIEVETFTAGGIEPIAIVCKINDAEFPMSTTEMAATVPVLSDTFEINVECVATDSFGRVRISADSIVVFKAIEPTCEAKILVPTENGITLLDSIDIVLEHRILGGTPPFSTQCRINGVPAMQEDSLFSAKVPLELGENLIIATCLVDDNCGFKAICTDSVRVTRIAEADCKVEIISPENEQVFCHDQVNVTARIKLPNLIDMLSITTMIGEEIVPITEDSLFTAQVELQSGRNLIMTKAIIEFENNLTLECTDSVYVSFDDMEPMCDFWPDAGKIVGVLTDSLSGLASIEVLLIRNAKLVIDEFEPGDKHIEFEVVPINPEKSISFNMRVTDVCGNSIVCDPVYVNLSVESSTNQHKIDFLSIDKFLTVTNSGVDMIRCKLNQKDFVLYTKEVSGHPKPNSYQISKYGKTTFDLSSELEDGNNLLEVELVGYQGASVEIFLADQRPQAIDYLLELNFAPQQFALKQNYPNPFNPSTNIEFEVPVKYAQGVHVKLQIYNILGELVNDLMNEFKYPGNYKTVWDGTNNNDLKLSSGIYILRMQADSFTMQRRMLLIK